MAYSEGRLGGREGGAGVLQGFGMLLADQQAGVPSGVLVTDQRGQECRNMGLLGGGEGVVGWG